VECNGKRPSQKGPRGRPGGQEVWLTGQILSPKIMGFFPKFPYKLLNSLLPLILEIWKENSKKGNPNIGITMLFSSHKLEDVIILA
jgi:hypothetical protein